jgi:myo-inositol-1(or 4)-monophosphatase
MLDDNQLARQIETAAVQMAYGAGEILAGSFGRQLSIEYKDKQQRDPVTSADKATQEYLEAEIKRQFPEHGVLGEETSGGPEPEGPAPDFLWVLDPLDGTTNFLNGLPVYASSIGVLYRGRPLAGALYIPWPGPQGGFVLHCRRGGGCFAGDEPVAVYQSEQPIGNRLIGLPGSFSEFTRFSSKLKGNLGELRTSGSIAYELAMTACGVMQYSIFGAPRMWDMLGGSIAVQEARGTVMTRFRGEKQWHTMDSLVPTWEEKPPSLKELRQWVAPLVAGNQTVAPLIAHNLRPRFRLGARIRRFSRRLRPPARKEARPATPSGQESSRPGNTGTPA